MSDVVSGVVDGTATIALFLIVQEIYNRFRYRNALVGVALDDVVDEASAYGEGWDDGVLSVVGAGDQSALDTLLILSTSAQSEQVRLRAAEILLAESSWGSNRNITLNQRADQKAEAEKDAR